MAPAHNLLRRQYNSYGNCFSITNFEFNLNQEKASLESSFMAEEEEGDDSFKGWLQLGIGIADPTASSSTTHENARVRSLMELNLFPERPQLPMMTNTTTNPSSGHPLITQFGPPSTNLGQVFGPQTELGVISPPARAPTGLWFELKAAENQGKQPFLPQIPKSYLRIKDGRMTIRLLMKYLARKLELDDESQFFD
ncbi:uncharacterized protein LOC109837360 isoform X2 [Asparagus officinalis]|uniref:uncharacterized protein LOC109837360 isoform X2 n=1 Tax=Asparagus officinalis TaxID=4686 RepID=UPI00098E7B1C|nr:uncharacterized protein LOC109837360 isoform X2 [Asparagus officinalis]